MKKPASEQWQSGLTVIELLIVIAIFIVVAIIIFVAVNPLKRLADSRDDQRFTAILNIRKAIRLFRVDNGGQDPAGVDSTPRMIGTNTNGCDVTFNWDGSSVTTAPACIDLAGPLNPYLSSMPIDPQGGSSGQTFYVVRKIGDIVDVTSTHIEDVNGTSQVSPSSSPMVSPTPSPSPSPNPSPSPSPQIDASLSLYSDNKNKYCAQFTITNSGSVPATTWQVNMSTNDSSITTTANATFTPSNGTYTITPLAANSQIPPGGSVTNVHFCANKTGPNYQPTIISASGS